MSEQEKRFECWGILEVMGHVSVAGRISEQTIAGSALVRVDIPEVVIGATAYAEEYRIPAHTQLFGVGSIYRLTPCDEEIARTAAAGMQSEPVKAYVPEPRPQLTACEPDDDQEF